MIYRYFVRPVLFCFDPETAHSIVTKFCAFVWSFWLGRFLSRLFLGTLKTEKKEQKIKLAGLNLDNQIGLAAGFDKNAELIEGLETLGFGFIEIGTVTPRPQSGNAKPRLFRNAKERSLTNRMGFNNDGALVIVERLRQKKNKISIPLGVNIGKNKDTPDDRAVDDYVDTARMFLGTADYFTINISSPNTPGLRALQSVSFLQRLSTEIRKLNAGQPIFVKLAPEVRGNELSEICNFLKQNDVFSGLVLTNTLASENGGISGTPLGPIALERLREARQVLPLPYPIISVGGIMSAEQAKRRLEAGASAIQLYTGLVYEGPGLVRKIRRSI